MKKFVVIYHAPKDFMAQATERNPEEMKEGMEEWNQWAAKCGDKLLDMGLPLMGGQRLIPGGTSEESSRGVVGYSLIQAADIEEAKALLSEHPHLAWDASCEIEVHEAAPLPG